MARGRPREFDPDTALDEALEVFARDGFEPTSVQTLADAMGICKPSLYAAYGNKEGLFVAALTRYATRVERRRAVLLDETADGRSAVAALLCDVIQSDAECNERRGCLLVTESAGGVSAAHSTAVREALSQATAGGRAQLVNRLSRAQRDGDLSRDVDVHTLADYFGAVMTGLSVAMRSGATVDSQRAVVALAMCAWPALATRQSIRSGTSSRSTTAPSSRLTK